MYYAELDHGEGLDLWRFHTKEEKATFLQAHPSNAWHILTKDAKKEHKEQWRYWQELE